MESVEVVVSGEGAVALARLRVWGAAAGSRFDDALPLFAPVRRFRFFPFPLVGLVEPLLESEFSSSVGSWCMTGGGWSACGWTEWLGGAACIPYGTH